jgi:hypothetical protein
MTPSFSVLQRAAKVHVRTKPFPCIVIDDALPGDLYAALAESRPAAETGNDANNMRWNCSAASVTQTSGITQLWKSFIAYHTSSAFYQEVIDVFGDSISSFYPRRFSTSGALRGLRAGVRGIDAFKTHDVLLDAQISGNTPVTEAGSVRTTHVDEGAKLFSGLFYMRLDDDDSLGGDLTINRFKDDFAGSKERFGLFEGKYVNEQHCDVCEIVPYARNRLVLFMNSLDSLHGVTIRHPTPHPRLFVNFVGEIDPPLYRTPAGAPAGYHPDARNQDV